MNSARWFGEPTTKCRASPQAKAEEEVKRYQEQLEDMVAQRTDELRKTTDIVELQHRSAVVANEATSFDEAMQTGLDAICAFTGWPVGHAYIRSPERADLLIPSNHWHLSDPGRFASFREVTEKSTFTTGIGLPGRILASGRPAWIVDVTTDPNFPRAKSSEDIGVKGAFALPVLVGSDVVAVLEFFSPEAANPDDTLLQTLEHIGTQLGRVAERSESERQLLEARDVAETATEAKAAFLATMSHEIRTPMTGVIGMVDMLVHTKLDDDQRQMMRTVRDSAYALLTIINDILDFSKIEAGKLELEAIPFSIRDTVEGVSETLRPNASNKGIRINVHVDPDIPDAVLGDQVRIRQILFNMAGNAVKFTEEGRVRICAFLGPTGDEKKATVRFEIIDTGIGISKEAQADLFTEFSQAESSTTRRFGGTGLGLSICQRLTEMMGGKIEVESELEKGSTFIVTLILPIAEEHAIKSDGHDLSGLNILIVSDDAEERELDAKYLRHWGAEVTTIGDIGEAKPLALEATGQGTPFDTIALGSAWSIETQVAEIEAMQAEKDLAGVRFVLMTQTRTKAERKDITNTLYVESDPLRRTPFIRAVAVAAGRASPDISYEDEEIVVEAAKAPTIEEAEAAGTLILVAEDNKTNQNVIRRQLNLLGYAAEMADDGKQALEAMKSKRYAVLLTDCHMPEMDGFELTQTIRKAEKDGDVRLPIIAITASVLVAEIDRCYEAGMDDSLLKPLELPKVKAALRKWMPVSEPADDAVREEKVSHSEGVDAVASSDGDGPIDPSALKSVEL